MTQSTQIEAKAQALKDVEACLDEAVSYLVNLAGAKPDKHSPNNCRVKIDEARFYARHLSALREAPVPSEEPVADDTGWLIELRGMVPTWWSLDYDNDEPHFTQDASKALRFARKQDADAYINDIGWTEAFASEHAWDAVAPHSDDAAVDRFAAAMKAKLAKKREEGRGGWDGPDCSAQILSDLMRTHVDKGDPLDVGNLAMMLHHRGERII